MGDMIICYNQMGDEEDANPTTAIGGGNITIHEELISTKSISPHASVSEGNSK